MLNPSGIFGACVLILFVLEERVDDVRGMFVIWCGLVHKQSCTTPFEWRMNMKIGRNDPCPCGSGKKYKHCHWGKALPGEEGPSGTSEEMAASNKRSAIMILAFGVLVSIGVGFWKGTYTALIVAAAWALGSAAYLSFRNPPPINENAGDPAALNFGNDPKAKK